jgi:ParB family chromosome partitioning protein
MPRALVRADALLRNRPTANQKRQLAADVERALTTARLGTISIGEIVPTPSEENSRQSYERSSIQEMADSIRTHGIIQPIVVRPIQPHETENYSVVINGEKSHRQYVIIAGNRRYHGAIAAGLSELPCVVRVTDADQAYVLNLVENLQRRELTGHERARAIARLATLQDDGGQPLGVREIARRTQFSVATISQWLNINKRPALFRAVEEERLDIGRAMRLATLPDEVINDLIETVAAMPRTEVERFVANVRSSRDFKAQQVATLNVRRAMQAYRAVTLIDELDDEVRQTLELTATRIADLLGGPLPSVSQANIPSLHSTSSNGTVESVKRPRTRDRTTDHNSTTAA